MVRDDDSMISVADPLRMYQALPVDGKAISPAQSIKLSETTSVSTANVQREATFTDSMESMLSYTSRFEKNYGEHFVDVRVMDVIDDMACSNALALKSRPTFVCYIGVRKMSFIHKVELPLLIDLGRDMPVAETLGITNLDNPTFYISFEEDIHRTIQTTDVVFINVHEPVSFPVKRF